MHVEFSSHFETDLKRVVDHLALEAHIFNSFNSTGETVVLSAERDELEKILEVDEHDFVKTGNAGDKGTLQKNFKNIKAIVRAHLD